MKLLSTNLFSFKKTPNLISEICTVRFCDVWFYRSNLIKSAKSCFGKINSGYKIRFWVQLSIKLIFVNVNNMKMGFPKTCLQ